MHADPTRVPTPSTAKQAREAHEVLRHVAEEVREDVVRLRSEGEIPGVVLEIPREAFERFVELLRLMGEGHAVRLTAVHEELTTQEAADLLNVSRPFLIRLLEAGEIPHRLVGNRRRVRTEDVLAYKARDDAKRTAAADALLAESQDLGFEY